MTRISATALFGVICLAVAGCGGSSKTATTSSTAPPSTQTPTSTTATTPPASTEVSPGVVSSSQGPVSATMHASTHHPRVNEPWPVSFTVTSAGKPVKAEVRYQYLFAGQVVARRSHYTFTGAFHDTFHWPSSAVGYPLTFRAVIAAANATLNLDYPVQVAR
jgi:hypothetical protein